MAKKRAKKQTQQDYKPGDTIDYTKMKVGTVTRRWTFKKPDGTTGTGECKIAVCPKCGKTGERAVLRVVEEGTIEIVSYTHYSEIGTIIPCIVTHSDGYCTVRVPVTAKE